MPHVRALTTILLATAVTASAWAASDAIVVHVDDGDTIDVRVDGRIERVRYIGIDAPEIAHDGVGGARGGLAAARLNRALVGGRHVRLEFDRERRDHYGRLLAYVWVGDVMINLDMIRRGYARVLTIPPNIRHESCFARAQAEAQAAHRGLWRDGDLDARTARSGRGRPRSGNWRTSRCPDLALRSPPHVGRRWGAGSRCPRSPSHGSTHPGIFPSTTGHA